MVALPNMMIWMKAIQDTQTNKTNKQTKKQYKSGKLCDEIYFISDMVVRKTGFYILMIDISHFLVT